MLQRAGNWIWSTLFYEVAERLLPVILLVVFASSLSAAVFLAEQRIISKILASSRAAS
jgi:hypothetical protein